MAAASNDIVIDCVRKANYTSVLAFRAAATMGVCTQRVRYKSRANSERKSNLNNRIRTYTYPCLPTPIFRAGGTPIRMA
ncbi:MAG TPA: hypothetical protein VJ793_27035, partial [Anaerolineae bacterium]|nr:hypothetical protein [Anaerolineae bacterium]